MTLSGKKIETPLLLRGLKGYFHGGRLGQTSENELSPGAMAAIITVVVFVVVISYFLKKAAAKGSATLFNHRQETARTLFMTHTDYSKIAHSPQSGTYNYTYMENDTPKSGTATFTFTELGDRRGYKISGKIVNKNGSSVIREGNVCYNGKNAYWKDEQMTQSGGILAVINCGEFNFEDNTFQGSRVSNRGKEETFIEFAFSDKNAQRPMSEQSTPQVYDLHGRSDGLVEAQVIGV